MMGIAQIGVKKFKVIAMRPHFGVYFEGELSIIIIMAYCKSVYLLYPQAVSL